MARTRKQTKIAIAFFKKELRRRTNWYSQLKWAFLSFRKDQFMDLDESNKQPTVSLTTSLDGSMMMMFQHWLRLSNLIYTSSILQLYDET